MLGEMANIFVESCLLAAVNIFALLGNISLFVVLLRKPALRTQNNMFLLNLAAADLLVSVVNMPMANATLLNGSWMFGDFVCTLTAFVNLLSLVASVMSLAMVSVNRYHHVVKWRTYQQHFSKRKCAVYMTMVWLFSAFLCFPPFVGWAEYRYIAGQSQCFVDWSSSASYTFVMVGICLCGPASIMAICYWKIWKTSKASDKTLSSWGKGKTLNFKRKQSLDRISENHSDTLKTFKARNDVKVYPRVEMEDKGKLSVGTGVMSGESTLTGNKKSSSADSAWENPSKQDNSTDLDTREATEHTSSDDITNSITSTLKGDSKCTQMKTRLESRSSRYSMHSRNDAKLTRTLVIIIAVFCLCWTPYAVTIIVELFISSPLSKTVTFGVLLLGYANSALNVVIYVSMSAVVRTEYRKTFSRFCHFNRTA